YNKKIEKFSEKVIHADTIELTDEMTDKAMAALEGLSREDLIKKILALEFNKLYKKVERDDLNLFIDDRKKKDKHKKDRFGKDGESSFSRSRERDRSRGRDRDRSKDDNEGPSSYRPNMLNYFINIGKIDNIHPVSLVELLSTHTGITKKS